MALLWLRLTSFRTFRRPPASLILAMANAAEVVFALIRGISLARLLTPDEFGLAITVTIVGGIVELVTDIGVTQMAVRAQAREHLHTLHSIAILRGVFLGIVVALCGPLFSALFLSPGTSWAYILVGLSSAIRSFAHLDVEARTRNYDFLPKVTAFMAGQVAWTVTAIVLAFLLRDFRAMAFGLLVFNIVFVALTHYRSPTPWRLAWDRDIVRDSWSYGRPLLLNGIANAISNLGDRTLTGAKVGLTQLAHYTALATSAFLPRAAIIRYLNQIFMPHFINATDDHDRQRIADLWFMTVSLIAGVFGFGYIALGQSVTTLVFGKAYQVEQTLVSLVALLGSVRYMACLPTPPALAYGKNAFLVRFTSFTMFGLGLGAVLLFATKRLECLVFGMALGEAVALFWALSVMPTIMPVAPAIRWWLIICPILVLSFVSMLCFMAADNGLMIRLLLCVGGVGLHLVILRRFMLRLRRTPRELIAVMIPRRIASDSQRQAA